MIPGSCDDDDDDDEDDVYAQTPDLPHSGRYWYNDHLS